MLNRVLATVAAILALIGVLCSCGTYDGRVELEGGVTAEQTRYTLPLTDWTLWTTHDPVVGAFEATATAMRSYGRIGMAGGLLLILASIAAFLLTSGALVHRLAVAGLTIGSISFVGGTLVCLFASPFMLGMLLAVFVAGLIGTGYVMYRTRRFSLFGMIKQKCKKAEPPKAIFDALKMKESE